MIVGGIEEIRLDEAARELYAADNYLGGRVMVFDLDTLQFKRGWGAYGHALSEISTSDADRAYTPGGPMPKEFRGHLTHNHVWFLNREDGKVIGQMGSMGDSGGQFYGLHMIAVDSKGNIYTGEVFAGERVQRFIPVK
jgi:hypothetical protein